MKCPDKACKFSTNRSKAMENHQKNTKHGQTRREVQYGTITTSKGTMRVKLKHKGPQNKKAA